MKLTKHYLWSSVKLRRVQMSQSSLEIRIWGDTTQFNKFDIAPLCCKNSWISGKNGCNGRNLFLQHTIDAPLNPLCRFKQRFYDILGKYFHFLQPSRPVLPHTSVSYRDHIVPRLIRQDEMSCIGKWKLDSVLYAWSKSDSEITLESFPWVGKLVGEWFIKSVAN